MKPKEVYVEIQLLKKHGLSLRQIAAELRVLESQVRSAVDLLDGGASVPFIARWPARMKPATTTDYVTAFWDLLPTAADLRETLADVSGQRALVVISDGKDTASKFTFDQTLEYARRAAVPIYVIGLGIRTADVDVRFKIGRLASETGGSVYYIEKAEDLRKLYGRAGVYACEKRQLSKAEIRRLKLR